MVQRIFLAINLPHKAKHELLGYEEKWSELPARWTTPENLHVTLVFLGNTSDTRLQEIQTITKEVARKHKPFTFSLQKIVYGPSEKRPRMIWVAGEKSEELASLQKDLVNALGQVEEYPFSLHITLARLKEWEFQKMELEERPEVNEEISLKIPVSTLEIMESKLKRGGAEYSVIESIPL